MRNVYLFINMHFSIGISLYASEEENTIFKLTREHGLTIGKIKNKENVTKSALASLRIGVKSYFKTYQVASDKRVVKDMYIEKDHPFYEDSMERIALFCENTDYQEVYLQCVFHFHHFFELLLKDILGSVHPKLAYKVNLNGDNSSTILDVLLNKRPYDLTSDNTAEFMTSLNRVISLMKLEGDTSSIPVISKIISDNKQTLVDLNQLRNRVWHKGVYVLRLNELDQFISQNVFPLVNKCLEFSDYNKLESYWKYKKSTLDPINEIIKSGQEQIDYERIAFFKAYGLACYTIPIWKFDLDQIEERANAIVKAIDDMDVTTCFVCNMETLLVSTETDFDTDEEGAPVSIWVKSIGAECLNCSLKISPDIGEPQSHGVDCDILWRFEDVLTET
ncbi:hypothetical protein NLX78_15245 [Paenibacillus sp. Lou8.1]|uniref:hypothetical protein n=1 Tax=Paenibacillus sp. Lou8.1 TaxID=2962041 RepID=UPI0020B7DF64|nr:hypothetical protein [Paenibacillus sp. Lou8.1]MCP3808591.1 hypothetical protein [Paenibacillus sp. Lou8.1]